ncbi:MAG: acetoacetate decarboxylase family protein [Cystobacter sp.]
MSNDFPPAPWRLRGQLYASVWWVPTRRLQISLDPSLELLTFAGRACVGAAFVEYQEGSVLTYSELFGSVSVRTRDSRRPGMTVTHMWVNSERSLRGGRALWGMPKELARFSVDHRPLGAAFAGAAWDPSGRELAGVHFQPLAGVPPRVRIPVPLPNLQVLHGRVHAPPSSIRFSPRLLRGAEWIIPLDSPLASLGIAGARPWVSAQARDFDWNLAAAVPVD